LPSGTPVRFIQPEVKGARRSKLVGRGTVSVEGSSLVFAGRRMLPLWAQILVVVGAVAASVALLGIVAWPIALAILFFGRIRHRESVPAAGVRSVAHEPGRRRFLVVADGGGGARCVAWQTLEGSAPLADALRQQIPGALREEGVRGWRTY